MVLTISKRKAVPLSQFAHLRMQTFSWENLKNYIFTPTLEIFQQFTVDLYTTYFSYGMKRNLYQTNFYQS